MPNADFLRLFRFFVRKGFFDADLCARLRAEMRSSASRSADVHDGTTLLVDERVRRTNRVSVSESTALLVEELLLAIQADIEKHFDLTLTGCQKPQFLTYREGDFFSRHDDSGISSDPMIRGRRISVVIFLSGESGEPREDSYGGGALTFFGLIDDPRTQTRGIPLVGEEGLLIGFPSTLFHSVTPVTHGERHTIVCWFR